MVAAHWYMTFSEVVVLWKLTYSNEQKQTVMKDPHNVHHEWLEAYKKSNKNTKKEIKSLPETKPMTLEEIELRQEKAHQFIKQLAHTMAEAEYWRYSCERAGRVLEQFWPRLYSFLLMIVICLASLYYTEEKSKRLP
jgi:hypothetical protein